MSSTSGAPRRARHRVQVRKMGKKTLLWLTFMVILLAFEVATRNIPPDGMTVTSVKTGAGPDGPSIGAVTTITRYSGAQYQAVINQLYDDFNTASLSGPLYTPTTTVCGPLAWTEYQITFTWRGLPVEVWSNRGGCPDYMDNSGGIPNLLWTHTLSPADQETLNVLLQR